MAKHSCSLIVPAGPARVIESEGKLNVLQLPCGGLKVLADTSLAGRAHCTLMGPFSPCPPGLYPAAPLLTWILTRLRVAAIGEAARMGARHHARAEVFSAAAASMLPGLRAEELLAAAGNLNTPFRVPEVHDRIQLSAQECRRLAVSLLGQAIQLRPSVVPVPDRILSPLDQQAEARHEALIDLALKVGSGLIPHSPAVLPRLELLLSEGRQDASAILMEIQDESVWA